MESAKSEMSSMGFYGMITDYVFQPSQLFLIVGDWVTIENRSREAHKITYPGGESRELFPPKNEYDSGDRWKVTFDKAGTFEIKSDKMEATLKVEVMKS